MRARRILTLGLAYLMSTLPVQTALVAQQPAAAQPAATSKLVGKVLGADGKPIAGARVVAYHLSTEQSFTSVPTGPGGEYDLTHLPYGYYDLAVETADGVFVGNQVVNIPPQGTASVAFTLTTRADVRSFPGIEQDPEGLAQVRERLRGRDFWRSSRGVAIISASGGAVLLAIAGGSGSSSGSSGSDSSPFLPAQ